MKWMFLTAAFAIGALLLIGELAGGVATKTMLGWQVVECAGALFAQGGLQRLPIGGGRTRSASTLPPYRFGGLGAKKWKAITTTATIEAAISKAMTVDRSIDQSDAYRMTRGFSSGCSRHRAMVPT